jgi:hypothetical protein
MNTKTRVIIYRSNESRGYMLHSEECVEEINIKLHYK